MIAEEIEKIIQKYKEHYGALNCDGTPRSDFEIAQDIRIFLGYDDDDIYQIPKEEAIKKLEDTINWASNGLRELNYFEKKGIPSREFQAGLYQGYIEALSQVILHIQGFKKIIL